MTLNNFAGGKKSVGGMAFLFYLALWKDVATFPAPADPKLDATTLQGAGEATTGLTMVPTKLFKEIRCEVETVKYASKMVNAKNGGFETTLELMVSSMDSETIGLVNKLVGEDLALAAPEKCGGDTKFMGSACTPVKLDVADGDSGATASDDKGYKLTFKFAGHGFNYKGAVPVS